MTADQGNFPSLHTCPACGKGTLSTVGSAIGGKWYCFDCGQKMREQPTSNQRFIDCKHYWRTESKSNECPYCQIERLTAELADAKADYHRWHKMYMDYRYGGDPPGSPPGRLADEPKDE